MAERAGNYAVVRARRLFELCILLVRAFCFLNVNALAEKERHVFRMQWLGDAFLRLQFGVKFSSFNFLAHCDFPFYVR